MFVKGSKKSLRNNKESSKTKHRRESRILIIPRLVPLAIKLGFVYLSFKRKAKKAGKIFKKELLAGGIDKKEAKLLTEEYLKTSHFLRGFDFSDLAKHRREYSY